MSYFRSNYPHLRFPFASDNEAGLRPAQLGAIHAAASHFVVRSDPGIITMPTGSGKTAVAIASAFILRAERVLVIVPSRLVREQIFEEFETLGTLRRSGAIGEDVEAPNVFNSRKRITSHEGWEALREFDVVVGTVASISPGYKSIPAPPEDLFDLVIVDEAHHSPARTWSAVLAHFSNAKQLLFTATPFRQDQREIKGRFIFTYDLKSAFEDGIFGNIEYHAVVPNQNEDSDVAIARAAERQFEADRVSGYQHYLMVRTDDRKRADELSAVYEGNTGLRLRIVTGDKSVKYVKKVIEDLRDSSLDGIICVNMLGEGFNLPNLKIAAIHSPHRSLSVTLQFIGRFARTEGERIGTATFLAIPAEIEIEAERLYDARAIWQVLVQNLSATRVYQEAQTREVLESFEMIAKDVPDLQDLSLYVLEPYFHAKVYQLDQEVDLNPPIAFPSLLQVVYESRSEAHDAKIYIVREIAQPRWTTDDRLSSIHYDLFVFYQDTETRLLFICASRRTEGLYEELVQNYQSGNPRPLSLVRLNRALNDLETPEFYNVGMRNRIASNTTESYRIIAGSNADRAIVKSDGRLYHRGHVFGRAVEQGDVITIGLSSASKVWSNRSAKVPELISWCSVLARRINSNQVPPTGSGLDHLDVGEEVNVLPPGIIAVDWTPDMYVNPPRVRYVGLSGPAEADLLDFDLSVDLEATTEQFVVVKLTLDETFQYKMSFSFDTDRFFEPAEPDAPKVSILYERGAVDIIDILNEELLHFYTADLALLHGFSLLRPSPDDQPLFDVGKFEVRDWIGSGVDIQREFGDGADGRVSVHEYLEAELGQGDNQIVYYDHGTGELADYIAIEGLEQGIRIKFYHCKGSSGALPGHRVKDVYEVVSQAVKSVRWALKQRILSNIRRRFNMRRGAHTFVRGNLEELENVIEGATPAQIGFEMIIVQPGLRRDGLPDGHLNILAAASDHLVRGGYMPLRVIGSR